MNPPSLPQPLQGVIPPIVTPLLDDDQIDVAGTERLIEHLLDGGVHGLFALGTTGEGTSLHPSTRHQFVELVCELTAGRAPVFVGVSDTSLGLTLELMDQSYAAGAAAVVAAPPYYLPMSQGELQAYMKTLADRSSLPLLLYNMPSCTKTALAVETVNELRSHGNIIGLKDSSGDLGYFRAVARMLGGDAEFTLLIGPEEKLVESIELGGRGGVAGGANLFPRLYVAMYEAAADGRWVEARDLQQVARRMSSMIYQLGDSGARVIQGIKAGLDVLGICEARLAPPFRGHEDHERAIVAEALSEIAPLVEHLCPGPQSTA